MLIEGFADEGTGALSYLLMDPATRCCALIDTVLGYDPRSGRIDTHGADQIIARVRQLGATVQWLLETHVHADHLSAAAYLGGQLGGRTGIGQHVIAVQEVFGALFNLKESLAPDGSQFSRLFADGESFLLGELKIGVLHTPGHTPACVTYVVRSGGQLAAFVGDTLFLPEQGTARCDFPGGDAGTLFRSIAKILALPDRTRLHMCHNYRTDERDVFVSTVATQKLHNIHLRDRMTEVAFIALRKARDATLDVPTLLLPAVQVNLRAGRFPDPENNGVHYLKIPLNRL